MNKFFRCMICLVVICAMVVQISPIQAHAISTGVLVAAGTVVASVLIGLGLSIGTDAAMHSDMVNWVVDWLDSAGGVITNGLISVSKLSSGHYGVPGSLIEGIFNLLYDAKVISSGSRYELAYNASPWGACTLSCSDPFNVAFFIKGASTPGYIVYSEQKTTVYAHKADGSTSTIYVSSSGDPYFYTAAFPAGSHDVSTWDIEYLGKYTGYSSSASEIAKTFFSKLPPVIGSSITTDYDLTLGHVALPGASLATGYPAWHANAISIPNAETGEDEDYYPLALGQSLEETQGMTQEDVWAGNGTYVDSEVVPGTGSGTVTVPDNATLKDILAGVLTLPQAIAQAVSGLFANVVSAVQAIPAAIQAIPAAIADIFTPSADVGHFSISLANYFPFCIPFDIYDFLTCLNADPVAPVIEWVIFERDGTGHPITVDLSPFDSVARILRTLQLLLFCVCLATKTRDLIKG